MTLSPKVSSINAMSALIARLSRRITGVERIAHRHDQLVESTVTFPEAFLTAPVLVCTVQVDTASVVTCWLTAAPTTTTFTVRIYIGGVAWAGAANVHGVAGLALP